MDMHGVVRPFHEASVSGDRTRRRRWIQVGWLAYTIFHLASPRPRRNELMQSVNVLPFTHHTSTQSMQMRDPMLSPRDSWSEYMEVHLTHKGGGKWEVRSRENTPKISIAILAPKIEQSWRKLWCRLQDCLLLKTVSTSITTVDQLFNSLLDELTHFQMEDSTIYSPDVWMIFVHAFATQFVLRNSKKWVKCELWQCDWVLRTNRCSCDWLPTSHHSLHYCDLLDSRHLTDNTCNTWSERQSTTTPFLVHWKRSGNCRSVRLDEFIADLVQFPFCSIGTIAQTVALLNA
jgi:hypothetical protein